MQALFEIIKWFLVKNLLLHSAFLWTLCDSRHLFGIGITGLRASSNGEFLKPYTTWNTAGVRENSDIDSDNYHLGNPTLPSEIWIIVGVVLLIFLLMCIFCLMACQLQRRYQWAIEQTSSSSSVFHINTPSVPQEDVQTPVEDIDVLPDYSEVVGHKTMALDSQDYLNRYPKLVGGKKLETPPPDYTAVSPFS